ncbi:MAG: hypothetical protein KA133_04730 [Flavobacterium sp.]|nr:hypothetical protein [Flavobacterium sp.]
MFSTIRNLFIIALFTTLLSNQMKAQPRKGKFINASVGLGLSAPYDDIDVTGSGFYAQGEYVWGITKWFGIRPYAGLVLTSADKNTDPQNQPEYKVTSKSFLLGGKARVIAPIPWVAPYFEVGVGASIGSFETYTPYTNIKKNGVIAHIPFSIGLALGPKHNIDVGFTYYYQPSVRQFSGATAIGFSFPLN